jgi:hypothetical protein
LHPLDEFTPGRLYVGLSTPGKSAQTPLTHIWGSLLQTPYEIYKNLLSITPIEIENVKEINRFWTVVGYFNAIRELAGVRAIYNQDFVSWMKLFFGSNMRNIDKEPIELSSRTDSVVLPRFLDIISKDLNVTNLGLSNPIAYDGVLTTSMFGTGVDIQRLGVMIMNGQPKTTANYIQATGRIGRSGGGLVITYLNAGRIRDLDHYEFFIGYHQALYRYIEPISVTPFAPECLKIAIGPLAVALIRQGLYVSNQIISEKWREESEGPKYIQKLGPNPINNNLFLDYVGILEERWRQQPRNRALDISQAKNYFNNKVQDWYDYVVHGNPIKYYEYTMNNPPSTSIVLGDLIHQNYSNLGSPKKISRKIIKTSSVLNIRVFFENAPNSLRGVEPTTTFGQYPRK